jgi:hypothetical protein
MRLLESFTDFTIHQSGDNPYLEVKHAVFRRKFGPWKKGHEAKVLRFDYKRELLSEFNEKGERLQAQDVRMMSSYAKLKEIVNWMDDPDNPETLHTKDGRRVYTFYSGTLIDTYLRDLYEEVSPVDG